MRNKLVKKTLFAFISLISIISLYGCKEPDNSRIITINENIHGEKNANNITNFLADDDDIYRINIKTENNALPYDTVNYVTSTINISDQNKTEYLLEDKAAGIRLRGNSTLGAPKKAYRIKFDKKTSLFDLPASKSYVLLANYYDKSNIRNYLAYLMARKMKNLYFQPAGIFVDVYLNDSYNGLYLLSEQMQTGEGRVDIENITNGDQQSFLLELEMLERAVNEGDEDKAYFKVAKDYKDESHCFLFKYPDAKDIDETNLNYIKDYMSKALDAAHNNLNIEDYYDINSFIDAYFVQEIFKNPDVGNTSCYYYLPANGKLTAGPVWDFDISLDVVGDVDPYFYYRDSELYAANCDYFMHDLLKISKIKELAKARYKELKDYIIPELYNDIIIVEDTIDKAQNRNATKWVIPGENQSWMAQEYCIAYKKITNYNDHYSYLKEKLDKRIKILDKYYL